MKSWKSIRREGTPEQEAANRAWVDEQLLELSLRAVREMAGKTQVELSRDAAIAQGELSKIENRNDHLVSTLRRYIEGLGGELDVVARFGDKSVKLRGV